MKEMERGGEVIAGIIMLTDFARLVETEDEFWDSLYCANFFHWGKALAQPIYIPYIAMQTARNHNLHVEPSPLLLHPGLPLPLLPTLELDAPVNPPQLQCKSWSKLLQSRPQILYALGYLPV